MTRMKANTSYVSWRMEFSCLIKCFLAEITLWIGLMSMMWVILNKVPRKVNRTPVLGKVKKESNQAMRLYIYIRMDVVSEMGNLEAMEALGSTLVTMTRGTLGRPWMCRRPTQTKELNLWPFREHWNYAKSLLNRESLYLLIPNIR